MPDNLDIFRTAQLLIKEHGSNAGMQAAMRVHSMIAKGDVGGSMLWKRIVRAIEELQRQQRRHDEPLN